MKARFEFGRERYRHKNRINPCWNCGHPDDRDESHREGCPALPRVPEATVFSMQRNLIASYATERQRQMFEGSQCA